MYRYGRGKNWRGAVSATAGPWAGPGPDGRGLLRPCAPRFLAPPVWHGLAPVALDCSIPFHEIGGIAVHPLSSYSPTRHCHSLGRGSHAPRGLLRRRAARAIPSRRTAVAFPSWPPLRRSPRVDSTLLALMLVAAVLHAGWNLLVKMSRDKLAMTVLLMLVGGALSLIAIPFFPAPAWAPGSRGSLRVTSSGFLPRTCCR